MNHKVYYNIFLSEKHVYMHYEPRTCPRKQKSGLLLSFNKKIKSSFYKVVEHSKT